MSIFNLFLLFKPNLIIIIDCSVLVKVFWKESYSNNTPRLRGVKALEGRILEKLGHPILIVDGERWTELPDHEKIPFLMHRIREKIEKLQWNAVGGSDVTPR